ncbi:MAG TPA: hypothetical protein VJ728_10655, partial [Candidatus Binataceae bacterium]|nr:hypothetical protein [Candidatus Binataceae bacterium]
ADFPHVWPTQSNPELQIFHGGERPSSIMIPVVGRGETVSGPLPRPNLNRPVSAMTPRYKIEHDLVTGTLSVITGQKSAMPIPAGGILELDHTATARVQRERPDQAAVEADTRIAANLPRLGELEIKTSSWFSHSRTIMNATVTLDGRAVFARTWRK